MTKKLQTFLKTSFVLCSTEETKQVWNWHEDEKTMIAISSPLSCSYIQKKSVEEMFENIEGLWMWKAEEYTLIPIVQGQNSVHSLTLTFCSEFVRLQGQFNRIYGKNYLCFFLSYDNQKKKLNSLLTCINYPVCKLLVFKLSETPEIYMIKCFIVSIL